ncbi:FliC domain-containing protein [Salix suchowensis]|nr:FliC domain-containing protein [Salix suchowensis]
MVFAINCGLDGAPNSFTNFKKSALAVGASLATEAATHHLPPPPPIHTVVTADMVHPLVAALALDPTASGLVTVTHLPPLDRCIWRCHSPAAPIVQVVTDTVTLDSEVWTTTYSSYPGSPAPTPASAAGNVHKVIVGGPGKLLFDPPHIAAQPPPEEPHRHPIFLRRSCRNSVAVADDATEFPTWSITVNGTEPIWAYVSYSLRLDVTNVETISPFSVPSKDPASHCGAGMVFAINSDEGGPRSFDSFKNVATALNGTAAAANAPSGTGASGATTSDGANNGAMSVNMVVLVR